MKLYCLQTKGLGEYYVVANNATEADICLTKALSENDYGGFDDRLVINTRLITEEIGKKPFVFGKGRKLLIQTLQQEP